jgi:uncharacterized protein (TIGR04255 family)
MAVTSNLDNRESRRVSRKYARAPITEAIIELRVEASPGVTAGSCKSVFESVRDRFPEMKEMLMMQGFIMGGQQVGAQASQSLAGYLFHSNELRQTVTASPDRFSFSQLSPYDSWDVFCPAAQHLWDVYNSRLKPVKIVRVATRFVNRIEIPLPLENITDYFRTAPIVSTDMSQECSGLFMQLQLPQKDIGCVVALNEAQLPAGDDTVPFILDIDIFDEAQEYSTDAVVWNRLNEFRWRKNEVFEACITDRVRKLIS